jgi:GTP1/Obg family GTP-binding protein
MGANDVPERPSEYTAAHTAACIAEAAALITEAAKKLDQVHDFYLPLVEAIEGTDRIESYSKRGMAFELNQLADRIQAYADGDQVLA